MTQSISRLDDLAEYPDWTHRPKLIVPGEVLVLPAAQLKWYDIRGTDQEPTPEVTEEAREFLRAECAAGRLEFHQEIGFVMNHRDGDKFFMIVCVWRQRDEMWSGIYFKDQEGFQPYVYKPGPLRATGAVTELDAVAHERRGWSRYLTSARDTAAKRAYLDDVCTGELV